VLTLDDKLGPQPDAVDTELDPKELVLPHLQSKTYDNLNLTGDADLEGLLTPPILKGRLP
jgi:hypothetical protein